LSPFQGFLLGYPDLTTISTVINPSTDAYSYHFATYAQDDWKVSRSLTLNYGLRWEYNPAFRDWENNMANFDPNYSSTIDGQLVKGAIILPSQAAFANLNPGFVQSVAPTPIFTAGQLGVPPALHFSSKKRISRLGSDSPGALAGQQNRAPRRIRQIYRNYANDRNPSDLLWRSGVGLQPAGHAAPLLPPGLRTVSTSLKIEFHWMIRKEGI
jgi:hypothetical protein